MDAPLFPTPISPMTLKKSSVTAIPIKSEASSVFTKASGVISNRASLLGEALAS
jgi:hypothetical protein